MRHQFPLIRIRFCLAASLTALRPCVLLALPCIGCWSNHEPIGRVFGTVTFEGEPFSDAELLFSNDTQGVHMKAELEADGHFEVRSAQRAGLPLGNYKIAVRLASVNPFKDNPFNDNSNSNQESYSTRRVPDSVTRQFPEIPPRYRNVATSGLSINVTSGDNPLNIDLSP